MFLFIFLALEMYFFIKFPNFLPAVMICMITHVSESTQLCSCLGLLVYDARCHG